VTERRACRVLDVNRIAYRYEPVRLPDEDDIRTEIIDTSCNFGRVGYRMVTNMMRNSGTIIKGKYTAKAALDAERITVYNSHYAGMDNPTEFRS